MKSDEDGVKSEIVPRDREYRITLLMLMALILLPASIAGYTIALIALIKTAYSVNQVNTIIPLPLIGIFIAIGITIYLAVHWLLIIKFYRAIQHQIIGWRNFVLLYGLFIVNLMILAISIWINLYQLPIYLVPLMLIGINSYLIYLRKQWLCGNPLA